MILEWVSEGFFSGLPKQTSSDAWYVSKVCVLDDLLKRRNIKKSVGARSDEYGAQFWILMMRPDP